MIIDSTKSEKVLITECIAKKLAEHTYNITGGKLQKYSINEIFKKIYEKEIGKYMILNEHEIKYIEECRR